MQLLLQIWFPFFLIFQHRRKADLHAGALPWRAEIAQAVFLAKGQLDPFVDVPYTITMSRRMSPFFQYIFQLLRCHAHSIVLDIDAKKRALFAGSKGNGATF